jgi:hypothetical protein
MPIKPVDEAEKYPAIVSPRLPQKNSLFVSQLDFSFIKSFLFALSFH